MLVAIFAPWLAPYPETALPGAQYITPTHIPGPGEIPEFPLGLDRFGGDVLSKLIWGARASLVIGVVSTAFGLIGGMILGLLARHVRRLGRHVDHALRRHPAVGAEPAARGVDRGDPRSDPVRR